MCKQKRLVGPLPTRDTSHSWHSHWSQKNAENKFILWKQFWEWNLKETIRNHQTISNNPMCQLSIDAFVRLAKFQLSEGFDAAQVSNRQMLITSMLINQANEKRAAATLKLCSRPLAACLNALNCHLCHVSGCWHRVPWLGPLHASYSRWRCLVAGPSPTHLHT